MMAETGSASDGARLRVQGPEVANSEALNQLVWDLPEPVIIFNSGMQIIYLNDTARNLGIVGEGKSAMPMSGSITNVLLGLIDKAISSGEKQAYEGWFKHGDKGRVYWGINCLPLPGNLFACVVSDWTVRKSAEQVERVSSQGFMSVFEGSLDGMAVTNAKGRLMRVNPALCAMLGYDRDELMGQSIFDLVEPELRNGFIDGLDNLVNGEAVSSKVERRYLHKAGHYVAVNDSVSVIRNADNSPLYLIFQLEAVTVRARPDFTANRELSFLRTIIETSPNAISVKDFNGRVVFANEAYSRLYNQTPETIEGKSIFDLEPDQELARSIHQAERTVLEGDHQVIEEEVEVVSHDGTPRWHHSIKLPLEEPGFGKLLIQINMDITAKKIAESALQLSEERFRYLFEKMGEGIVVIESGQHSRIVMANPKAEELFGVGPGELIGRREMEFVAPNSVELAAEHIRARQEGKTTTYEMTMLRADGEEREFQVTGSPWFDEEMQYVGSFSLISDVTERKRSDRIRSMLFNISQESTRVRGLEDLIQCIHAELDKLIKVHNMYVALYDEGSGMFIFPYYVDEHDVSKPAPSYPTSSLTEYVRLTGEPLLHRPDDGPVALEQTEYGFYGTVPSVWLGVPLSSGEGVNGVVAVQNYDDPNAYDQSDLELLSHIAGYLSLVIKQKSAEESLRESEKLYRRLVDGMKEGLSTSDTDGNITFANRALENIMGVEPGGLQGENIKGFLSEDQLKIFLDEFSRRAKGEPSTYEIQVTRPDGELRDLFISVVPRFSSSGKFIGTSALLHDLTERNKAQVEQDMLRARIAQAQKMESLGTLAGGIAHDFNNILFAILGYNELALEKLTAEGRPYNDIKHALAAGKRAKELVDQILSFARKSDQKLMPVRVSSVLTEVLKLVRASLPSTIRITHRISDQSAVVMADPTHIHQVMMNLCTNAGHAMMGGGGVMDIEMDVVSLDETFVDDHPDCKPGPYVLLKVRDNGTGMKPEVLERIFDPFYTTKEKGQGTGMGLAVVHGIISSLQGAIDVSSEHGIGTTFSIYLPKAESIVDTGGMEAYDVPRGSESIMVVDDEESLVLIITEMLGDLGYKVRPYTNSVQALAEFTEHPEYVDIVLTDLTMPNYTGTDLAREIHAIRPELPLILLTGYSHRVSFEKLHEIGIRRCLSKPITKLELSQVIREVLDLYHKGGKGK